MAARRGRGGSGFGLAANQRRCGAESWTSRRQDGLKTAAEPETLGAAPEDGKTAERSHGRPGAAARVSSGSVPPSSAERWRAVVKRPPRSLLWLHSGCFLTG